MTNTDVTNQNAPHDTFANANADADAYAKTKSQNRPSVISGLGDTCQPGRSEFTLDETTYDRALDCVHCGLCLPACPTYTQNGLEADSPRGRIHLIKGLADGRIQPTAAVVDHLDLCLDCRACETACPSGVVYHELIQGARTEIGKNPPKGIGRSLSKRVIDFIFYHLFPYPTRLRAALLPARIAQKLDLWQIIASLSKCLPRGLSKMQQMLPEQGPLWQKPLLDFYPATRTNGNGNGVKPKATIALHPGCVGSVLFQEVNEQTIALLQLAGCDVIVPQRQGCCGAIHHHGGRETKAKFFAKANIDAFIGSPASAYVNPTPHVARKIDYIATNIAGCGAALKEYDHLLRDDPIYAEPAKQFVAKVRDINELLVEIASEQLNQPPNPATSKTATYHDACHLAHAQGITDAPRQLLTWIQGLNVIPLTESDMCCGAAGTYNLSQPEMATELATRKIQHIQNTGATTCITANVGCAMQIQSEAKRLGINLRVVHPVSMLYEAHFGAK